MKKIPIKRKKLGNLFKFLFNKVVIMITAYEISQLLYILISLYFFSSTLRLFEGHLVLLH